MPHPLDRALALSPGADGRRTGATIPDYGNFTGQFGGITAATLLKAALDAAPDGGEPVSLTVNYCAGVKPGPFEIATRVVRAGRTMRHLAVDMIQDGVVVSTALVALAHRKSGFRHQPAEAPAAPPPEAVAPLDRPDWTGWAANVEFRFVEGSPEARRGQPRRETPGSARSLVWLAMKPPRALDVAQLAFLSDAFFVRMLQVRNAFPPMATVSLTTQFLGTAQDLAAHGEAPLLARADSRAFRDTIHDQTAELWSRDGTLLAVSHQIVWFAA